MSIRCISGRRIVKCSSLGRAAIGLLGSIAQELDDCISDGAAFGALAVSPSDIGLSTHLRT